MKSSIIVSLALVAGCASRYDFAPQRTDAGLPPVVNSDSGEPLLPDTDGGVRMPREVETDAGSPVDGPISGEGCDPTHDNDVKPATCRLEGCDPNVGLMICAADETWHCFPTEGTICTPVSRPEHDAGMSPTVERDAGTPPIVEHDAGTPVVEHDAGTVVTGECVPGTTASCDLDCGVEGVRFCLASATYDTTCRETAAHRCPPPIEHDAGTDSGPPPIVEHDAGTPVVAVDAGPACEAGTFVGCWLTCLGYDWPGHVDCDPTVGYFGPCEEFEGLECSTFFDTDAGTPTTVERDAGAPVVEVDAGTDSGPPPVVDAGTDAGTDSGPPPAETRTIDILFAVTDGLLASTSSMDLLEERAEAGATHAYAEPAVCDAAGIVTEGGRQFFHCRMTRPLGAELFFAGRFRAHASSIDGWSEGQTLATMSGWGRRDCGSDSATAHVLWVIRDTTGRSLLNPDGLPDIVQPRGITEDGYPVCRGRVVFDSTLP